MLPAERLKDPLKIAGVDAPEAGAVADVDDRAAAGRGGRLRFTHEFDRTVEHLDQIGGAQWRPGVEGGERGLHCRIAS